MLVTSPNASMETETFITVGAALLLLLSLRWIVYQRFPLLVLPRTSFSALFKSAIDIPPEVLSRQIIDTSKKGPVVRIGTNEVVITDNSLVRSLYASFSKWPEWYESPEDKLFYGQLSLFGMTHPKEHSARRRILSNVFSKSLRNSPHVKNVTREILLGRMIREAEIPSGSSVVRNVRPVHEAFDMDFLTAFAFTPTFSTNFLNDSDEFNQFCSWVRELRGGSPDAGKSAKCNLENWCLEMCRAYRAASLLPTHQTISHCTAEALYSAGLQEREVAAEILDHLITAKKNLAVVHTYSVYMLSIYTDVQERIREELRSLSLDTLSIDGLDSLPFFNAVVSEIMRTHTEVKALTPRQVPDAGYLIPQHITGQSTFLPAGTVVSSTREALHSNADIFPQPLCFWPERWMGSSESVNHKLAGKIQPQELRNHLWYFGSGTYGCVAREYALYEIKMLLAATYMEFSTIVVDCPKGIVYDERQVLFPPAEVPVRFQKVV
ncbi:uncharacterized protein N7515_000711 [Penicillium bovifimosum]|uniref:Cytochrome P450 n=1 Tax=Penicillium bovifimosum TaxID=126998 RepID=A0A9W9HIQ7_9EURO|nr:uncharacterized protein N7515_000711 [Penicillium bovifimosum]KAJ5146147.1 hypothetical protein N7515_000711 [Penicillium bovifimosum]